MNAFKAHVENGRIIVDDPTDLPDGTELYVVAVDEEVEDRFASSGSRRLGAC